MSLASQLAAQQFGGKPVTSNIDPVGNLAGIKEKMSILAGGGELEGFGGGGTAAVGGLDAGQYANLLSFGGLINKDQHAQVAGLQGGGGDMSQLMALLLSPELHESNAPFIFAQLLQSLQQPGGILSGLYQDQAFGQSVQGLLGGEKASNQALNQQLIQQGLNPAFAGAQIAQNPYQALGQIANLGTQTQLQKSGMEAEAGTAFANVLAQSEEAEKFSLKEALGLGAGLETTLKSAELGASATKSAGQAGLFGGIAGGLLSGI